MDMEECDLECDLNTLMKAKEIQSDKSRLKKVQEFAKSKVDKINSIADLKKEYAKVVKEEQDESQEEDKSEEEDSKKSIEVNINLSTKGDLTTEEDKVVLQDKKELSKINKGKLGDLKYNG